MGAHQATNTIGHFRQRLFHLAWILPLACAIPIVGAIWFPYLYEGKDITLAFAAAAALLVTWVVMYFARSGWRLDFFEPVFAVFVLNSVFFPVRVLVGIILDDRTLDQFRDATFATLFVSSLGFTCFALGYRIKAGERLSRALERVQGEWDVRRANAFVFALVIVGFISWVAIRYLTGSVYTLLLAGQANPFQWNEYPAWFYYLLWGALLVPIAAIFQLVVWLRYGRQPVLTGVLWGTGLLTSVLVARLALSIFLVLTLLLINCLRRRLGYGSLAVAGLVLVIYLSVAGMARSTLSLQFTREMTGWSMLQSQTGWADLSRLYLVQGFDNFWWLGSILDRVPSEMPYQYGTTFLPVLAKPIPRVLWPDKPLGASAVFNRQFYPENLDNGFVAGVTALGEWYMNFSWPGVLIGMFLMGMLASASHRLVRGAPAPGGVLVYGACLVGLVLWYRNEFNIGVTWFLYYLIPFATGLWLVASRRLPDPSTVHG